MILQRTIFPFGDGLLFQCNFCGRSDGIPRDLLDCEITTCQLFSQCVQ